MLGAATMSEPSYGALAMRLPGGQPCLVSDKILLISSIFANSSLAMAGLCWISCPPPPPASLVASLNSVFSWGIFKVRWLEELSTAPTGGA